MSDHSQLMEALQNSLASVRVLKRRLAEAEGRNNEAVAIVGLGCRLPGAVYTPDQFWQLLQDGHDAITEVPPERWSNDEWYDPDPETPARTYTRSGGFIEGIDRFDPVFFGISPREARSMDPQQRLLLEVAWEALERSGQNPQQLQGARGGVFVGICSTDYSRRLQRADAASIDPYTGTGNVASVAAGRLSFFLGLLGPSIAIDTACSSSLVTVHLACQSLRSGECDVALAGGVNLLIAPETTVYFSKLRVMSAQGQCRSFDAGADGYVRSEGCGFVVLRRLSDALRRGDPILAVIRGSAVNQDGRSQGLTAPRGPAQVEVIRQALTQAGIRPEAVGYVRRTEPGRDWGIRSS